MKKLLTLLVSDSSIKLSYSAGEIKINGRITLRIDNERTYPVSLPLHPSFICVTLEFPNSQADPQALSSFKSMQLRASSPVTLPPDTDNEVELILPTRSYDIGLEGEKSLPTLEDYRNAEVYLYISTLEETHKVLLNKEVNLKEHERQKQILNTEDFVPLEGV